MMTSRRSLPPLALSGVLATLALAPPASAQNPGLAEGLYRDGQRLLAAGQVHEACIKFEESQRNDPALGTLINLATCHEREGRTATAWSEFITAAAQAQRAGQRDREQYARTHATALEGGLVRVVLEASTPAPGLTLSLDGQTLGAGALGTGMPLDPGDHRIVVSAPGRKPWSQTIRLAPVAATHHISIPPLEEGEASPSGAGGPPDTGRRTAGWGVGGVGVAGIALGSILAVRASIYQNHSSDEAANAAKPTTSSSDVTRLTAASSSDHAAGVANEVGGIVALVAGAAAVGTGLYLVMSKGADGRTPSAWVAPAPAGLRLGGTF